MNEEMKIQELPVAMLIVHPENRKFKKTGEEWESFVKSIESQGILMPLMVHPCDDKYELIAGERRWTAACDLGMETVPVIIRREFEDEEILALILIENLHREGLDAIEEARGVRALVERAGLTTERVGELLSKSVEWVLLRQGLLDLPDEAQGYVSDRKVELGVIQMILHLPPARREEALQLVLHPTLQEDPLNARNAERVLEKKIIEPARLEKEWAERKGVLKTRWTVALREISRDDLDPVNVQVADWSAELPSGKLQAVSDEVYLSELTESAPEGCRWLHLAQRHGIPVMVYPKAGTFAEDSKRAGSLAMCDAELAKSGEQAGEEHEQGSAWLASAVKRKPGMRLDPDDREDEEEEENEESRTSEEIKQSAELSGWVDLGKVMQVKKIAKESLYRETYDLEVIDWIPDDLMEEIAENPLTVIECLDWVLSLPGSVSGKEGSRDE